MKLGKKLLWNWKLMKSKSCSDKLFYEIKGPKHFAIYLLDFKIHFNDKVFFLCYTQMRIKFEEFK